MLLLKKKKVRIKEMLGFLIETCKERWGVMDYLLFFIFAFEGSEEARNINCYLCNKVTHTNRLNRIQHFYPFLDNYR